MKIYHTKIEIEPIANNGSSKFGYNAKCKIKNDLTGRPIEVEQFGRSAEEARDKILRFIGDEREESLF